MKSVVHDPSSSVSRNSAEPQLFPGYYAREGSGTTWHYAGRAHDTWRVWSTFVWLVLRHPLLVVRGEKSDLLSASAAEKMQLASPGAKIVVVPGVGHAPTLSEPITE